MGYWKGLLVNIQFFTSIPIPWQITMDRYYLEKAVKTFPILGLLLGLVYYLALILLLEFTPLSTVAIAFVIWLLTILLTGGLHLDGWMDASDAFFSYQEPNKRLEIMKDPRTGAFGVLTVIVLLTAKFLFIYEFVLMSTTETLISIVLIPFLSRSLMGVLLTHTEPAKQEGLAHFFHEAVKGKKLTIYIAYILFTFALISGLQGLPVHFILWISLVAIGGYLFVRTKCMKWFNGITGDVLGASVEGIELLLWMTLWLLHYSVMG